MIASLAPLAPLASLEEVVERRRRRGASQREAPMKWESGIRGREGSRRGLLSVDATRLCVVLVVLGAPAVGVRAPVRAQVRPPVRLVRHFFPPSPGP